MESKPTIQRSDSSSSSDDGLFNIGGDMFVDQSEEQKKLDEQKALKKIEMREEMSKQHKNCYKSLMTKEEKAIRKIAKVKSKRKHHRELRKKRRREFLATMTEEEKDAWADQQRADVIETDKKLRIGVEEGMIVCVDCGFEDSMHIKEVKSLDAQLAYVYGRIKRSSELYSLHVLGYEGTIKQVSEERFHHKWQVKYDSRSLSNMITDGYFGEKEIIYLSPDAEEELTSFDREKVYIIGGIVDNTVNLHQTNSKARQLKISAKKLPLDEVRKKYPFRPCLNINTVFYILDDYLKCKNIEEAIIMNLPDRFKTGRSRKVKLAEKKALKAEKKALAELQKTTEADLQKKDIDHTIDDQTNKIENNAE